VVSFCWCNWCKLVDEVGRCSSIDEIFCFFPHSSFFDCSNKRNSNNQLDVNRTLSCLYHQMIGGDMKNDATDSKDNVFLHRDDDIGYMSDVLTYDSEALNDIKKMKN